MLPRSGSTSRQEYLEYSELFQTAHATGRVDGHGIGGAKTRQFNTSIGFWLDGWIRRNCPPHVDPPEQFGRANSPMKPA